MTPTSVRDPKWASQDLTMIVAQVVFDETAETYGEMPFGASPTDPMEHGRLLFAALVAGEYGPIAPFERLDVTVEDLQDEFDAIWPDVMLGLADQATIDLAKNLRVQIKAMS